MKKLLMILGAIGTIGLSAATVIACGVNQNETIKHDLDEIVKNTHLGEFFKSPSDSELLIKAKELNPSLQMDHVVVLTNDGFSKAEISVKEDSNHYNPATITLTFTVNEKVSLNQELANKDLGVFRDFPTEEEILTRVATLNPTIFIHEVEVYSIGRSRAIVQAKDGSTKYVERSSAVVAFTIDFLPFVGRDIQSYRLGNFDEYNQELILAGVQEENRNLKMDELEVIEDNEVNLLILGVKVDSDYYAQGQVRFSYRIDARPYLEQVVLNTFLGEIAYEDDYDIINALAYQNPSLILDDIEVIENNGIDTAVINAKETSYYYKQKPMTVTYTLDQRLDLQELITITNLGMFDSSPSNGDILERVLGLNPGIVAQDVQIMRNDGTRTAAISAIEGSMIYKYGFAVLLQFTVDRRPSIINAITETELGQFYTTPTNQQILDKVKELNPALNLSQVELSANNGLDSAEVSVIANSTVYRPGTVTVTYSVDQRPELNTVLTNTALGMFGDIPTDGEVLAQVGLLNPNLDINELEVMVNNETDRANISVKVGSTVYKPGNVTVNYTIDQRLFLTDVIKVTDLGYFENKPSAQDVFLAIRRLNPDLDFSQVWMIWNDDVSVTVKVSDNSEVYRPGSVEITYSYDQRPTLDEVLLTTELGTFYGQITNQMVLDRVAELNPNLDLNELTLGRISFTGAALTVKPGSTKYRPGTIELTYNVIVQRAVKEVISQAHLGTFGATPNQTELSARIRSLNPELDMAHLTFVRNTSGRATYQVIASSVKYFQGTVTFTWELTNKIDVTTHIQMSLINLGPANGQSFEQRVVAAITKANPRLDVSQLIFTRLTTTRAEWSVIINSYQYRPANGAFVLRA